MSSSLHEVLQIEDEAALDDTILRADLDAALQEDKVTLKSVEAEIGIPYGTLSSWRGGTYAGRQDRIRSAVRKFLDGRKARILTRNLLPLEPGFQKTATAMSIWEVLEFAQATPAIGLVTGGPGVGKTVAFEGYQTRLPNVWIATMQPCHQKLSPAVREIALSLGLAVANRTPDVCRTIIHRMKNSRGLLIVDEAQHLAVEALDQIRSFYDAAGVGIVFGGNKQLASNVGADRRRDQLAQIGSRIGMRFRYRDRPLKADIAALLEAWNVKGEEERRELSAIAMQPGGARTLTVVLRIAISLSAGGDPTLENIKRAWMQLNDNAGGA